MGRGAAGYGVAMTNAEHEPIADTHMPEDLREAERAQGREEKARVEAAAEQRAAELEADSDTDTDVEPESDTD